MLWLAVQDKKARNVTVPKNSKVANSWLVGLVKCVHCGYSVTFDRQFRKNNRVHRYLVDYGWITTKGCLARSFKLRTLDLEDIVLQAMHERIETLNIAKKKKDKPDAETEAVQNEIIRIDNEIRSLMDRMADADDVVFGYIQQRIKELHSKKSELEHKLQTKARKHKAIDTKPLEKPLAKWSELSVQEQHELAAAMIDVIYINHENEDVQIIFGI